jgi:hypothetical protein
MAVITKCYEIVCFVVPEKTFGLHMVDLEILQAATVLAAPPVSLQYFFPQFVVTSTERIRFVSSHQTVRAARFR